MMTWFKALVGKIPRKIVYVFSALVLNAIAVKFPSLPLPTPDTIADWTMVVVGAHTLTDIAWIVKTHLAEVAKERRERGVQP